MSKARGPYRVDPLGYKKANEALDKKAENDRALGLDYEPVPVQEPTDIWFEKCFRSDTPAAQRQWAGLTDEQIADYLGDEYHNMTESELRFFKLGEQAYKENT